MTWAPAVLLALVLLACIAPALVRRFGRGVLGIFAIGLVAIAAAIMTMFPAVVRGDVLHSHVPWIAGLGLSLDLRMDALAAVMCTVITVIGAAVLAYSVRYFPPEDDGLPKYAGSVLAFAAAMLGLVLADNLILLVVCWELTGILSYLLIAHRVRRLDSRRAASQALMVTTAGGLALLVGAVLLGVQAGTFTISAILEHPPGGAAVATAVALMLVGAVAKSAIVPFHFWLPGAMAAPTPASAYLHAATMVKAGVYLAARFAPAFASLGFWRPGLVLLGALTMLVGGIVALRQRDLKLLLAYGTVSQLGLMTMLTAFGTPDALVAVAALIIAHAIFKGALFFVVGIIDTATGTRDITRLSGVGRSMPVVAAVMVVCALSMAGLPPMIGFVAKEAGYAALLAAGPGGTLSALLLAAGSALTVAYSARLCWGALARKPGARPAVVTEPSLWMVVPTGVLAMAGLVFGLAPQPVDRLVQAIGGSAGSGRPGTLALWHGWGAPPALTLAAFACGLAVFAAQRRAERRRGTLAGPGRGAGAAYRALAAGVDLAAMRVTAGTQRGSLPVSLGAIVAVLVIFPGTALVASGLRPGATVVTAAPVQAVLALVVAGLAVAALRARGAVGAVLMVGGVGYVVAVLYLLRGAPDLALTQLLVETVTLVVAVLVLLRMPATAIAAPRSATPARVVRIVLAVSVGALMAALALVLPGVRREAPALAGQLGAIAERGGGHNVVNVVLVDVRGWDTFGEISVLVAAAIGVSSLIFLRNPHVRPRRGTVLGPSPWPADPSPWLATNATPRRSLLLEVATRLVFHLIIIFSLYVLLVGHDEPGGGFAAGLIAGIAVTLRYLAGGRHELGETAPVDAGVVMGLGLVIAALTAIAGVVAGDAALTSATWQATLPVIGHIEIVTSTVFDLGVYLVVVGMVLEVLRSVGAELDRQAESGRRSGPRQGRQRTRQGAS